MGLRTLKLEHNLEEAFVARAVFQYEPFNALVEEFKFKDAEVIHGLHPHANDSDDGVEFCYGLLKLVWSGQVEKEDIQVVDLNFCGALASQAEEEGGVQLQTEYNSKSSPCDAVGDAPLQKELELASEAPFSGAERQRTPPSDRLSGESSADARGASGKKLVPSGRP